MLRAAVCPVTGAEQLPHGVHGARVKVHTSTSERVNVLFASRYATFHGV